MSQRSNINLETHRTILEYVLLYITVLHLQTKDDDSFADGGRISKFCIETSNGVKAVECIKILVYTMTYQNKEPRPIRHVTYTTPYLCSTL